MKLPQLHDRLNRINKVISGAITADSPMVEDAVVPVTPDEEMKQYYKKSDDTSVTITHRYYLTGGIDWDCKWYHPLLQTLDDAKVTDIIEIHLNNYGGMLYAANQLINAVQRTKGKVRIIVTGICASAATMLLLGADYDEYIIDDFSHFLFHTGSTLLFGKFNELKDDIDAANQLTEKMYSVYYEDILTEDEINQVLNGKELWLIGYEVRERLTNRIDLRQREYKREEKKKEKQKTVRSKR